MALGSPPHPPWHWALPSIPRGAGQNPLADYDTEVHYVYVLQSTKDFRLYTGRASNLRRRYQEHQSGKVASTRSRRPLLLIFYEAFTKEEDAIRRERYLKTDKGRSTLRMMLQASWQKSTPRRGGEMANAADSKSAGRKTLRVQVPPPAPCLGSPQNLGSPRVCGATPTRGTALKCPSENALE